MKFGGDPKLLRAPLSNTGMPLIGFQQGGHVNQWRDELLHAPMSNIGNPVMGLFEQGGMVRDNLMRAPMSNIGMPLIGFKHGGMPCRHGGNCYEEGGMYETPEYKEGGHWIPKNLKKGRCTPMGTPECPEGSPQYNLAKTFKKHHGFHKEYGGPAEYKIGGGFGPEDNPYEEDPYRPTGSTASKKYPTDTGVVQQRPPAPWRQGMTDIQAQQQLQNAQGTPRQQYPWMQAIGNAATQTIGAGLQLGSHINSMNNMRDVHRQSQQMGLTGIQGFQNPNGLKGDYTPNTHMFRPQDMTPASTGMYYPSYGQYGGKMQHGGTYWNGNQYEKYNNASPNGYMMKMGGYSAGQEMEMEDDEIQQLIAQGYKVQYI